MLTAYMFDRRSGEEIESWSEAFPSLNGHKVLWIYLCEPSEDEVREVREGLGLRDSNRLPADRETKPSLEQHSDHLRVTSIAVSDEEDPATERVVLDCFVGPNWVVTANHGEIEAIEDFRKLVEGEGEIGILDAPSFLATLLEWVVASYLRAFEEIDASLEEFDVQVLTEPANDPGPRIQMLVDARRRLGSLRRALAPHREIFTALSHAEFDPVSSERSAERFAELATRVDAALSAAHGVRDEIASSFDVLIVRTEHRTNEIMKVLTLASILFLPGALIAGVAGMNVNLEADTFVDSGLFWGVLAAIVGVILATLALARFRRWI